MKVVKEVEIGMNTVDLAQVIFQWRRILLMEFTTYQCEEKPHFDEAKKKNPKARRSVVEALQHTPDFKEPVTMVQSLVDFDKIRGLIANLKKIEPATVHIASYIDSKDKGQIFVHEAMKVISRVRTLSGIFHIPLLDLDIPIDEIPRDLVFPYVKDLSRQLGIDSGALVDSGRSYHLWGFELMSEDVWHYFMHQALLLDRIDRRWIGHRLLDGQANLRVSPKWGKMPKIVYIF